MVFNFNVLAMPTDHDCTFEMHVNNMPDDTIKPKDTSLVNRPDTSVSNSAITTEIRYSARDSIPMDMKNNILTLYGEAEITYGDVNLKAAKIKIDWKNNLLYAEGMYDSLNNYIDPPVYTDKGVPYKAKKIIYNFKSRKGKLFDLITQEGESYIHGSVLKKDSNDVIYVNKAKYTTCSDTHPHFYISAGKIEILKNQIISGPAYMVIQGVPVPFAIPFGFFPNKNGRASGIILPAYGESQDRGFFLRGFGYYFGLSDYFDLMLKGDAYSNGSWLANVTSTYSKRYKFRGNLNINYARNKYGDPETPEFSLSKDFSVNWVHTQDPKARPSSTFSANINAGTQNSYRNNSTNAEEILNNTLQSSISYSKGFVGTPFSLSAGLRHTQNLSQGNLSLSVPDFSFNMARIYPFKGNKAVKKKKWYSDIGIQYNMNFRNKIDTYDSLLFEPETWDMWKNGFSHSIPLSTSFTFFKYLNFSPQFSYTGYTYAQKTIQTWEGDTLIKTDVSGFNQISQYNVSGRFGTKVYGLFNVNRLGLIAIRQLITPSVTFSYQPDFSDLKYGYYSTVQVDTAGNTRKYSYYEGYIMGYPGTGKQGNMSFDLQNNIEAKVRDKKDTTGTGTRKVKLLENFGIGSSYNFLADSMNLAPFQFNGYTTLLRNKLNFHFSGNLDPYMINEMEQRVNKFTYEYAGKLARLTNFNFTLSTNFNSPKEKKKGNEQELEYVPFSLPWNMSIGYTFAYNKPGHTSTTLQSVELSGYLNLTSKWRVNFRTGYDFNNDAVSFTSLDIHRDLHCWEMSFSWIPIGYRQSYSFKINVKSSVLKDLKLNKKKDYYDYSTF
jgi:lipopolysaccharide assembly outer membrane protein LptD (OstA)